MQQGDQWTTIGFKALGCDTGGVFVQWECKVTLAASSTVEQLIKAARENPDNRGKDIHPGDLGAFSKSDVYSHHRHNDGPKLVLVKEKKSPPVTAPEGGMDIVLPLCVVVCVCVCVCVVCVCVCV